MLLTGMMLDAMAASAAVSKLPSEEGGPWVRQRRMKGPGVGTAQRREWGREGSQGYEGQIFILKEK